MKKIVLFAVSLVLCVSAMAQNQRAFFTLEKAQPVVVQHMAPAQKAELGPNQRLMGLYTTDECVAEGKGLSFGQDATTPFGAEIPTKIVSRYVGGRIVGIRYAMAAAEKVTKVFVQKPAQTPSNVVEKAVTGKCKVGWNTVMFDKPYTIADASSSLIIGFEGTITGKAGGLSIANTDMPHERGFMIYDAKENGGSGYWITFRDTINADLIGDLSVQAIVEFDKLYKQDLQLSNLVFGSSYATVGKELTFALNVRQHGTETANDYELNVMLDKTAVGTVKSKAALAGDTETTVEGKFTVPAGVANGAHMITVEVAKVNGVAPTVNLEDDKTTAEVNVFAETKPRQKVLIEHFTSHSCTYCYLGDNFLEKLSKLRNDMAWVAIHGNQSAKDPFNSPKCENIMRYGGRSYFPSASFNRTYFADQAADVKSSGGTDQTFIYLIGFREEYAERVAFEMNKKYVDVAAAMPSFTTLTLTPAYNPTSRTLSVNVKGEGVSKVEEMLKGYGLYVYVTEDSVVDRQYSEGKWVKENVHNHVMREVLTSEFGDAITWTGDNFSKNFTYQVPETFKADQGKTHTTDIAKMRIIAFVAPIAKGKIDVKKMNVDNCEMSGFLNEYSAVENVEVSDADAEVVAVYSITGQQLSAPQKGINIVRLSNGKTKKIMVTE